MRFVVIILLVIALFAWVFSVILSPQGESRRFLSRWAKLSPSQQRRIVLEKLPWAGKKLKGDLQILDAGTISEAAPERKPKRITWDMLYSKEWQPGGMAPKKARDMHGANVRIVGHLLKLDEGDPVSKYLLVPSLLAYAAQDDVSLTSFIILDIKCPYSGQLDNGRAMISGRLLVGLNAFVEGEEAIPIGLYRMQVSRIEEPPLFDRDLPEQEEKKENQEPNDAKKGQPAGAGTTVKPGKTPKKSNAQDEDQGKR